MQIRQMVKTVTIADGQSLSDACFMEKYELVAVVLDSGWNTAAVSFAGSYNNSNFFAVWNGSSELSYAAMAASTWIVFDPAIFYGMPYLKVRSGTSGAAVAQTGATVVSLIMRPII